MDAQTELTAAIAGAVTKTVGAVETAAGFLSAQAPEVIEQLLMWNLVKSSLLFFLGLLFIYTAHIFSKKWDGVGVIIRPDTPYDSRKRHEPTLTHDRYGLLNAYGIFLSLFVAASLFIGISLMLLNFDWLKILLAEKIWLMEYAAYMVR